MKEPINSIKPDRPTSRLTRFLWFCSGANTDILEACPQSEHHKYTGIGATVFFTGVLASLSGGYALYTVFREPLPALAFGILWGLVIFNIDRFIVSTMRKEDRFLDEFKLVLPRLALALILAIVIAKPLELKIFEREITRQLEVRQREFARQSQQQAEAQYDPQIARLRQEIGQYQSETGKLGARRDSLYEAFIGEAEGSSGTFKLGKGPVYKEKKQQFDKTEQALAALQEKYAPLIAEREQQILDLMDERGKAYAKAQPAIEGYDGLMARIDALGDLPALPSLFIFLLFLCIETAPVISKLLSRKGPYDELLYNAEHTIELDVLEQVHRRNQDLGQRLQAEKALSEQESESQKQALKVMADAHLERTREMAAEWLERERKSPVS